MGTHGADHATPLYLPKLALKIRRSPSINIVRLRTKSRGLFLCTKQNCLLQPSSALCVLCGVSTVKHCALKNCVPTCKVLWQGLQCLQGKDQKWVSFMINFTLRSPPELPSRSTLAYPRFYFLNCLFLRDCPHGHCTLIQCEW
jgi:hypothetical protein